MANKRYIISTEKGFICDVDWVNGRTYPDGFSFNKYKAQSLTRARANVLVELLFANCIDDIEQIEIQ